MENETLAHSIWVCTYHAIWIPKYRKKRLFDELRRMFGEVFHEIARQKICKILEGHLLPDHVHVRISIPPKLAVSSVIEFIKGKSAIYIARNFQGKRWNFLGESFGPEAFMCRPLALMKLRCATTSVSKNKKI